MNWLIYISGWFFGLFALVKLDIADDFEEFIILCCMWTMAWIWICWRFIK